MEQSTRLFLEGYTTNNLSGIDETYLMPSSRFMEERLQRMLDSSELLKLNKRQAQYLAIQNQINPHFLYNTLESIRSEALIAGLTSVSDMTEALAAFFRYTISKVENLVSVEEELQNCETYFKIQRYRFGVMIHTTLIHKRSAKTAIQTAAQPKKAPSVDRDAAQSRISIQIIRTIPADPTIKIPDSSRIISKRLTSPFP